MLLNPTRPDTQNQVEGIKTAAQSVGRELVLGLCEQRAADRRGIRDVGGAIHRGAAGRCRRLLQQPADTRLSCWQPATAGRRSINGANSLMPAAWQAIGPSLFDSYRQVGAVRRAHSQGRKARRPAGAATDEVRVRHQSQDREGARLDGPAGAARPRRRGDRIGYPDVRYWHKPTSATG